MASSQYQKNPLPHCHIFIEKSCFLRVGWFPQLFPFYPFSAFCVGKSLQLSRWLHDLVLHDGWCWLVRSPGLLVSVSWGRTCSPHSVPASVLTRRCRHSVCRYFSFQIKCIIIWSEFRRRSWSCASSCTPWCSAEASTLLSTGSSAITSSLSNKDGLLFSLLFDLGRLKHLPIVGFKRFVFINHLGIRYIFLFST